MSNSNEFVLFYLSIKRLPMMRNGCSKLSLPGKGVKHANFFKPVVLGKQIRIF